MIENSQEQFYPAPIRPAYYMTSTQSLGTVESVGIPISVLNHLRIAIV